MRPEPLKDVRLREDVTKLKAERDIRKEAGSYFAKIHTFSKPPQKVMSIKSRGQKK